MRYVLPFSSLHFSKSSEANKCEENIKPKQIGKTKKREKAHEKNLRMPFLLSSRVFHTS